VSQDEREKAKWQLGKEAMSGCGGCGMMIVGIVGLIIAFLLWVLLSSISS